MKKSMKMITAVAMLILLVSSCKKEGPVSLDYVPPSYLLTLQGGGQTIRFSDDHDYLRGQLNLKPNTKYTFNYVAADSGSIWKSLLILPKLFTPQIVSCTPNDTSFYETTIHNGYYILVSPSHPYTSTLHYGEFTTPDAANEPVVTSMKIYCIDFRSNFSNVFIDVNVTNSPIGGYGWVAF